MRLTSRIASMVDRSEYMHIGTALRIVVARAFKASPPATSVPTLKTNALLRTIQTFLAKRHRIAVLPIDAVAKLKILLGRQFELKRLIFFLKRNVFVLNGDDKFSQAHDLLLKIECRRRFNELGYCIENGFCFRKVHDHHSGPHTRPQSISLTMNNAIIPNPTTNPPAMKA